MNDETLIYHGDTVKALGGGKVGGYLVRFTGADDPDLTGEYFTASTDFGAHKTTPVLYQHGLDATIKNRKLGEGALRADEVGVWVEAQLALRDEYEREIYRLAEEGKLGWSSGTAAHLVAGERRGKARQITSWPLGLDASLTPTPAEPRNMAVPLKSIIDTISDANAEAAQDSGAGADGRSQTFKGGQRAANITGDSIMADNQEIQSMVQAALKEELAARDAAAKAETDRLAALKTAREDARKEAALEFGKAASRRGGYAFHRTAKAGEGDDSETNAFKYWLRTGDEIAARRELAEDSGRDEKGVAYKAALGETTGANGGFLVPTPFYDQIVAKRDEQSIPRKAGATIITTGLASIGVPVENAKQGNFAIVAEAGAVDESEPTFSQVAITVYNWRRLLKVSTELLQDDQTNLDAYLAGSIGRAQALTENNYTLVGTGAGQPQGVNVGGTLGTTAAAVAALTAAEVIGHAYKLPAGYRDNAAWVMATATEGHVRGLTSNFLAFNPTPAGKGQPQAMGAGGEIWQYPVFNSASMPALATGNKTVNFGCWAHYGLVERQAMIIERNPWLYMANGQVGIFASVRWGGAVLQAEAFQYIQQA